MEKNPKENNEKTEEPIGPMSPKKFEEHLALVLKIVREDRERKRNIRFEQEQQSKKKQ